MHELHAGARVAATGAATGVVERARRIVETFLPRVEQVITQTRVRLWGGDTRYRQKLFSLFEPQTEAIRKSKAAKPTESGDYVTSTKLRRLY